MADGSKLIGEKLGSREAEGIACGCLRSVLKDLRSAALEGRKGGGERSEGGRQGRVRSKQSAVGSEL